MEVGESAVHFSIFHLPSQRKEHLNLGFVQNRLEPKNILVMWLTTVPKRTKSGKYGNYGTKCVIQNLKLDEL